MHYNERGDLVLTEEEQTKTSPMKYPYIPKKHLLHLYGNIMADKELDLLSPLYTVTREMKAWIINNPPKEYQYENGQRIRSMAPKT